MATKPFKGIIDIDVRNSAPDWEPYAQPKAPGWRTQRVIHRVGRHRLWRAVTLRRADRSADHGSAGRQRAALQPVPHHRDVLAHPRVAADRPQSHHRRHGLHLRSHRPASPARTATFRSRRRSSAKC